MTKHLLTISTEYVPDWTYVESVRELFQNAIDNEIQQPTNKMEFAYDGVSTLRISNKESVLPKESLLLGSTSKRNDSNTIGQHGEGYKIALMVLLREGKNVTFYNYGEREVWRTRLIKARRYNNQVVPEIVIDKKFVFKKPPTHDLTIEVSGITPTEYKSIVDSNLHLQENVDMYKTEYGDILLSPEDKGKVYVGGLYVATNDKFRYGYNFAPSTVSLDRDRKLLLSYEISLNSSKILYNLPPEYNELVADIVSSDAIDGDSLQYLFDSIHYNDSSRDRAKEIGEILSNQILSEQSSDVILVDSSVSLAEAIKSEPTKTPVLVSPLTSKLISSVSSGEVQIIKKKSSKEKLNAWLEGVKHKLTEEEVSEFELLLDESNLF